MTDPQPPVPPVPTPDGVTPPPAAPTAPPVQPAYPAYGQQPQAYGPPNNTLAIVAMVLSLAGIITGITALVGAILGHVALGQIKRTGEGGRQFAMTAIIVGWILTGLGVLIAIGLVIFYVVLFASLGAAGAFTTY